jgi:hypothetical protein
MLSRLERAIEGMVDGSIARAFRLRVQPAEIGRQLERAMLDGRTTSVGATLAPNLYEVRLHPDDAAPFSDWNEALCREMEAWLAELAFARGVATVGPIRVELAADAGVRRRSVRAAARFSPDAGKAVREAPADRRVLRLLSESPGFPEVSLVSRGLSVGRASDNDLVIVDATVSRHHARLEPDGSGWRVVDLDSTNGTWLNGGRISRSAIAAGDALAFASARYQIVDE